MKFSIFIHMERFNPNHSYQQLYEQFLQICQLADTAKLHAIWTGEHHGMNFTIAPNPFITIAALAQQTRHTRLGTGTVVAPFWHPIKLAEEAAMADIICNGRLDLGIARGAYSFEYDRLTPGVEAVAAGNRLREIIPAVKKLWRGNYQAKNGTYIFPKASAIPKPLQDDGPPIWVAARDISSHEFAIQQKCHVQVTPLWLGMEEIKSLKQKFDAACKKHRAKYHPKILLLHHTFVGKNAAEVNQISQELSQFYCYFGAWFKNDRPVSQGFIKPLSPKEMAGMTQFSPAEMQKNLTIGTARQVIDKLKIYQQLGYSEYAYWVDSGLSHQRKIASLKRFIDEVIPKVK